MNKTNWTKKATVLLAAIGVLLATLSGLGAAKPSWVVQVEGVPIDEGLYRYFLSEAADAAPKNKDGQPADKKALRADVLRRCSEYAAVGSELRGMKVALSQSLKTQAATRTAGLWFVFGDYYTSVGVDKLTLGRAVKGQMAKEQLFRSIYGAGGKREVPKSSVEAYFYGNYVAYDGIRVFPTVTQDDGADRDMTAAEKTALRKTLQEFVTTANGGGAFDFLDLAQEEPYAAAFGYALPRVELVSKTAQEVPAAVFEQLRGLDPAKVALVETPSFLLVARGVNMRQSPEEFYKGYSDKCLRALKSDEFAAALAQLTGAFSADERPDAVSDIWKTWKF